MSPTAARCLHPASLLRLLLRLDSVAARGGEPRSHNFRSFRDGSSTRRDCSLRRSGRASPKPCRRTRKQPATRSWWSRSSPAGTSIEDYGYQLGRSWGIGQKGRDTGVLLIVVPTERKVRIEVGYGLEGTLTDATSRVIIERIMTPAFRSGQFGPGIVAGVGAILKVISGEAEPVPEKRAAKSKEAAVDLLPAILIFGGFILFMWLAYRNRESGLYGPARRRRGTWIGWRRLRRRLRRRRGAAEDSAAEEEVSAAAELPEIGDMPFLTADDIRRIERAVEAAEERTAAEFVTVIAHSSGSYLYLPTLAAAAATLLLSGVALVRPRRSRLPSGSFTLARWWASSRLRAVPMVARPPAHRAAGCSARSSPIARTNCSSTWGLSGHAIAPASCFSFPWRNTMSRSSPTAASAAWSMTKCG